MEGCVLCQGAEGDRELGRTLTLASQGNYPRGIWKAQDTTDSRREVGDHVRMYYGNWSTVEHGVRRPRGRWTQTLSLETVSAARNLDSLAFWLSFD